MAKTKAQDDRVGMRIELQESRVRQAIQAAREDLQRLRGIDPSFRSAKFDVKRPYADRMMAAALGGSEAGAEKMDKVRAECRAAMRDAMEQYQATALRRSHATAERLRSQMESWRRQHQAAAPNLNLNFVVLDTPALILPSQDVNLVKVAPAPWNNVVKLTAGWSSPFPDNGGDYVTYVFTWRNPGDQPAVINVASYLSLNGYCDAMAGPGLTDSAIWVTDSLFLYEWWNDPPTQPPFQMGQYNFNGPSVDAQGGGVFGVGDFETMQVGGNYDVEYRMFTVPPNEVAVFMVNFDMFHGIIGDGYIDVDFASGEYEVICPALIIAILN